MNVAKMFEQAKAYRDKTAMSRWRKPAELTSILSRGKDTVSPYESRLGGLLLAKKTLGHTPEFPGLRKAIDNAPSVSLPAYLPKAPLSGQPSGIYRGFDGHDPFAGNAYRRDIVKATTSDVHASPHFEVAMGYSGGGHAENALGGRVVAELAPRPSQKYYSNWGALENKNPTDLSVYNVPIQPRNFLDRVKSWWRGGPEIKQLQPFLPETYETLVNPAQNPLKRFLIAPQGQYGSNLTAKDLGNSPKTRAILRSTLPLLRGYQ